MLDSTLKTYYNIIIKTYGRNKMENIIEKLFNLALSTNNFTFRKEQKENAEKEWHLYGLLYDGLTEKNKKILLEYLNVSGTRHKKELSSSFEAGFKTAIKLIVSSLKEE